MQILNTSNFDKLFNIKQELHAKLNAKTVTPLNPFNGYITSVSSLDTLTVPALVASKQFIGTTEPTGGTVRYVVPSGAGAQDGTSWANAFSNRQDAVSVSNNGDRIYVLGGMYKISTVQTPCLGVSEYYGFTPSGLWADRNPLLNPSIHDAGFTENNWNNSSVEFTTTQIVDGFWIQNVVGVPGIKAIPKSYFKNCSADTCSSATDGGGAYLYNAGSVITNSFFTNCSTKGNGGGLWSAGGAIGCVVNLCISPAAGGGMYLTGNVLTTGNKISNSMAKQGGGCYITGSRSFTTGFISNSYATAEGGGALTNGYLSALRSTTIVGCQSGSNGGGLFSASSASAPSGCIFINNWAVSGGGAAFDWGVSVANCVAINCGASVCGGGFRCGLQGSTPTYNTTAINCFAPIGSGFMVFATAVFYNNVAWGCDITFYTANFAYKIFNCASDRPFIFGTNAVNLADIRAPLLLTEFCFKKQPNAPFNIPGSYYRDLLKTDTTTHFILNTIIPNVADPHPTTTSPLKGAGYHEAFVTPTTDADGITRSNPPSIGAYE